MEKPCKRAKTSSSQSLFSYYSRSKDKSDKDRLDNEEEKVDAEETDQIIDAAAG